MYGFIKLKWHVYYTAETDDLGGILDIDPTDDISNYIYFSGHYNYITDNEHNDDNNDEDFDVIPEENQDLPNWPLNLHINDTVSLYRMEGDIIYSLFNKHVKVYIGTNIKKVFYIQLYVKDPSFTRHVTINPLFYNIKPISYHESRQYGWSTKSKGFHICNDNITAIRDSTAGKTDALYGLQGFSRGIHHWIIRWEAIEYGMHPVIGVGVKGINTQIEGYAPIVGTNDSYGWHLGRLCLLHNMYRKPNILFQAYPGIEFRPIVVPTEISVILDMETGTLGFMAYNKFLGSAFTGLKGKRLYPMVSTTWANARIQIRYVGGLYPNPDSLLYQSKSKLSKSTYDSIGDTFAMPAEYYRD